LEEAAALAMAWPPRHRLAGKIRKSHGTFDTWPWVVVYRKSLPCADKQQGRANCDNRAATGLLQLC